MDFLCDERQFVSSFLKMSRECYGRLLFLKSPNHTSTLNTRHLYDASVSHTVRGFVEEVKQCVNLVHSKHIPMQLRSWMFLVVGDGKCSWNMIPRAWFTSGVMVPCGNQKLFLNVITEINTIGNILCSLASIVKKVETRDKVLSHGNNYVSNYCTHDKCGCTYKPGHDVPAGCALLHLASW